MKLEMNFLPPAYIRCEACGGTRFNRETLDIDYRGHNIAQVLAMSLQTVLRMRALLLSDSEVVMPTPLSNDDHLVLSLT